MYEQGHLGLLHQINRLKQIFRKNKVVTGKTSFFDHFVLLILLVLTFAFDRPVLYGNVAFSILVPSTKKQYSSFLKYVSVCHKIISKVKCRKRSKFPVIVT